MAIVAPTILEHYQLIFKEQGEKRGEVKGRLKECKAIMASLKEMLAPQQISHEAYQQLAGPLEQKIANLERELDAFDKTETGKD